MLGEYEKELIKEIQKEFVSLNLPECDKSIRINSLLDILTRENKESDNKEYN